MLAKAFDIAASDEGSQGWRKRTLIVEGEGAGVQADSGAARPLLRAPKQVWLLPDVAVSRIEQVVCVKGPLRDLPPHAEEETCTQAGMPRAFACREHALWRAQS